MATIEYISAHQPAFMPWLGYIKRISLCNIFVILDDVQFEKNSFSNRNKILNKSLNTSQWLTVPILIKGHFEKKIKDIQINKQINWKKKHLRTISQEYKHTKQFKQRFKDITEIYEKDYIYLIDLNMNILNYLLKLFSIKTKLYKQSDLRITGKNNQLIVSLCKKFNINNFIFGSQGKNYVDNKVFKLNDLCPLEHQFTCFHSKEITNNKDILSSIDLIFRLNDDQLKNYLKLKTPSDCLEYIGEK